MPVHLQLTSNIFSFSLRTLFKNFWYSSRAAIFFNPFQYLEWNIWDPMKHLWWSHFAKITTVSRKLFSEESPSQMFDRVLKYASNINKNLTCIFLNQDRRFRSRYAITRNQKLYHHFDIKNFLAKRPTIQQKGKIEDTGAEILEKTIIIRQVRPLSLFGVSNVHKYLINFNTDHTLQTEKCYLHIL